MPTPTEAAPSERHRDEARRLALRIPAPCVCVETPLCNQHKAAESLIAAFAARVEADTLERCAALAEYDLTQPAMKIARAIRALASEAPKG